MHASRHELPQRRADLYESLLELLIGRWEAARFKIGGADEARRREQYSLAEFLKVGKGNIRAVLERLAFEAHAGQDDSTETADIPAEKLIHRLCYVGRDPDHPEQPSADAPTITDYLRDRVGILYQRGGDDDPNAVYTFPHRSFQEYLAACYLRREETALFDQYPQCDCDDWTELAAELGRTDPDRWREVVLLAGSIKSLEDPKPVWELVAADELRSTELSEQTVSGVCLACQILADNLKRNDLRPKRERVLRRVQSSLSCLLRSRTLAASERAAAGIDLARIGDPRDEVMKGAPCAPFRAENCS